MFVTLLLLTGFALLVDASPEALDTGSKTFAWSTPEPQHSHHDNQACLTAELDPYRPESPGKDDEQRLTHFKTPALKTHPTATTWVQVEWLASFADTFYVSVSIGLPRGPPAIG